MKLTVKIAALLLVLTTVIPILFACKNNGEKNNETPYNNIENTLASFSEESYIPEAEKGIVTAPAVDAKRYNIIFALATVPPVLADLFTIIPIPRPAITPPTITERSGKIQWMRWLHL